MDNKLLRRGMIFGTVALIWSIPSLNIFGIAATILSWIAYSKPKKGSVYAASGLYIAAAVVSVLFAVILLFAGGGFRYAEEATGISYNTLTSLMNGAAAFSLVGDILYIAAAAAGIKGGKTIKDSDSESNGFFD